MGHIRKAGGKVCVRCSSHLHECEVPGVWNHRNLRGWEWPNPLEATDAAESRVLPLEGGGSCHFPALNSYSASQPAILMPLSPCKPWRCHIWVKTCRSSSILSWSGQVSPTLGSSTSLLCSHERIRQSSFWTRLLMNKQDKNKCKLKILFLMCILLKTTELFILAV